MKKVYVILFVVLIILAIYILYKLIAIEELSKTDRIIFIILLIGSLLQSVIWSKLKKKQGDNKSE